MKTGRKIAASACALLMAASTATGAFAADDISGSTSQQQTSRPAQEMMQGQKQMAPPEMNSENRPADLPEMNGENRPADLPEMNGENRPADLPEMNGENRQADMPEMKEGGAPAGAKEAGDVLNEINKSGNTTDETVQGLIDDYSSAVDSERNATDSDTKMTAAKLVKEIVDAINSVLEKMGISARINAPADKPEATTANMAEKASE